MIPESSGHYEHPGRCVRHHARRGRGGRPDHAAEAARPDQHTRALQQLESRLHHPPLRRQGQSDRTGPFPSSCFQVVSARTDAAHMVGLHGTVIPEFIKGPD